MNPLHQNQLFNRRNFIQRIVESATIAGAGATVSVGATFGQSRKVNPWAYDDSSFRRTDPERIRYREKNRFEVLRHPPRCLAMTGRQTLLIGSGKYVSQYGLDGALLTEFVVGGDIRCLASGEDGSVYVGLRGHVEIWEEGGNHRSSWESPGAKAYFTGLTVGKEDVFVADAGGRVVIRYDRAGNLKGLIGRKNSERKVPGFIVPSPFFDVEIATDGLLRVTNPGRHQVEAYTFEGDLEFAWGKAGAGIESFCGCCNPINLALLPSGQVITFEKGIPRVKLYSLEGRLEGVVAGTESFSKNAKACGPNDCTLGGLDGAVDAQGRIYILDLVAANVRVMERKDQTA